MNCAFHALMEAIRPNLPVEEASDLERYYSVLRHATAGDTGIYVGCAIWALGSTITYGRHHGYIHRFVALTMWYADWVSSDELVRHTDNELAASITRHWWEVAHNYYLPSCATRQKFIVFDLATGHASYQLISQAHFPMAVILVDQED